MALCDPKAVLEQYARAINRGRPTRGEMGILITLNLRWLPYMLSQKQALGLETIRYHFEPTEDEALAQEPGRYTFYFDRDRELWKAAGERETRGPTFTQWSSGVTLQAAGQMETQAPTFRLSSPPLAGQENLREICQTGLQSTQMIALRLDTIAGQSLLPGDYDLRLLLVCPSSETEGDSIFNLSLARSEMEFDITTGAGVDNLISRPKRIDVARLAGGKDRALQVIYPVNIPAGFFLVQLEPVKGSIYLSGIALAPGSLQKSQHA
jgi:hypothetical protein